MTVAIFISQVFRRGMKKLVINHPLNGIRTELFIDEIVINICQNT